MRADRVILETEAQKTSKLYNYKIYGVSVTKYQGSRGQILLCQNRKHLKYFGIVYCVVTNHSNDQET